MKPNEKMAREFAEKYNGKIVGIIRGYKILESGEKSRAGYKVEIDGLLVYTYLINTWHNKRKGISISDVQLQEAIDENALILQNYKGTEYVANAVNWDLWARQDNNYERHSRYGGQLEVFCKQENFRILDLDKYELHRYYPD